MRTQLLIVLIIFAILQCASNAFPDQMARMNVHTDGRQWQANSQHHGMFSFPQYNPWDPLGQFHDDFARNPSPFDKGTMKNNPGFTHSMHGAHEMPPQLQDLMNELKPPLKANETYFIQISNKILINDDGIVKMISKEGKEMKNEMWELVSLDGYIWKLKNKNKVLSGSVFGRLMMMEDKNDMHQLWVIQKAEKDNFFIFNVITRMGLEITKKGNVRLHEYTGDENQKWTIHK